MKHLEGLATSSLKRMQSSQDCNKNLDELSNVFNFLKEASFSKEYSVKQKVSIF